MQSRLIDGLFWKYPWIGLVFRGLHKHYASLDNGSRAIKQSIVLTTQRPIARLHERICSKTFTESARMLAMARAARLHQ